MIVGKEGFVHVPLKPLECLVKGSIINALSYFILFLIIGQGSKQFTTNSYRTSITNLLSYIGSYKFCVKSSFHNFVQKLHELHVMINMNDIFTY